MIFGVRKLESGGYHVALFASWIFSCFDRTQTCNRETETRPQNTLHQHTITWWKPLSCLS